MTPKGIPVICRIGTLLLVTMLFLGQLIAFAPAHGATVNGSGQTIAASAMPHVELSPMLSMSDHEDGTIHHSGGAHCIGCAIVAPLYSFGSRSVKHSQVIPFVQMLAHSVQLPHFRPPIAPFD
jgi:hypothetical protein